MVTALGRGMPFVTRAAFAGIRSSLLPALALLGMLSLVAPTRALSAQDGTTGGSALRAARAELEERAMLFETAATARASSSDARGRAAREAARVRERLRDGDFQVGDRVVLVVPNDATLSDTFVVGAARTLQLGNFGTVSLQGVLRSELQARLRDALGRYFREPEVTATALIRLGVLGAVSRPGYYALSPDVVITDAVMQAGGPRSDAELGRTRVRRGTRELWNEADLRIAMRQGLTLDDMNLVAGDEIVIAARRQSPWTMIAQTTTVLVAVVGLAISLRN